MIRLIFVISIFALLVTPFLPTSHVQNGSSVFAADKSEPYKPLSLEMLRDIQWVLKSWGRNEPAPEEPRITLMYGKGERAFHIKDGEFTGKSACNRYWISVKEGDTPGDIVVGHFGRTKRGCPEPIMQLENRFWEQLENVKRFGFMNGQLMLEYVKDGATDVMLFEVEEKTPVAF